MTEYTNLMNAMESLDLGSVLKPVAFIPMRAGSKRIRDKEKRLLGKYPLMAYTIRWAIDSGVFGRVVAVTRSTEHARMAEEFGAETHDRPAHTVRDHSPDIDWVSWILQEGDWPDVYSILRVTSPFRTQAHINEAYDLFRVSDGAHSLRTVTPVSEHPGKMWVIRQDRMLPLLPMGSAANPWHSSPTQSIFRAYLQTAGMEFARTEMTKQTNTIAGSVVVPYVLIGWPALDLNTELDWFRAEQAIDRGLVKIPESLK